jgi:hypothetical protein
MIYVFETVGGRLCAIGFMVGDDLVRFTAPIRAEVLSD